MHFSWIKFEERSWFLLNNVDGLGDNFHPFWVAFQKISVNIHETVSLPESLICFKICSASLSRLHRFFYMSYMSSHAPASPTALYFSFSIYPFPSLSLSYPFFLYIFSLSLSLFLCRFHFLLLRGQVPQFPFTPPKSSIRFWGNRENTLRRSFFKKISENYTDKTGSGPPSGNIKSIDFSLSVIQLSA